MKTLNIFKAEFEQQSLHALFVLINTIFVPGRARLAMEAVHMPQVLQPYEQTSLNLLGTLHGLEGNVTGNVLDKLRFFLESHVVAIETRAAIAARREAESGLVQAAQVCGTAGYLEGEIQGEGVPRISLTERVCICLAHILFIIFIGASVSLFTHNWAFLTNVVATQHIAT